jgi:sugar/nucleoside kinase (ribokinase family)
MTAAPKVACVGVYILDLLGRPIETLPRGQVSQLIEQIRLTAAGTAGGTSVDLARLGADVLAVGAIGTDDIGDILLGLLERNGVSGEHLARKQEAPTSATILPIHPNGDRPAWHVIGANGLFGPDDVPWDAVGECDFVHLGGISAMRGFDGEPSTRLLRFAKEHGATTTADCLGVKRPDTLEILTPCLPSIDLFIPNANEARQITGRDDPLEAALQFYELGAGCVIVKMGEEGCLIVDETRRERVPAYAVPAVDSTGCGDAFCAGVIIGLWRGWEIERCARLGTAAAALTLGGLGSDAGITDLPTTIAFMESAPLQPLPGS